MTKKLFWPLVVAWLIGVAAYEFIPMPWSLAIIGPIGCSWAYRFLRGHA